MLAKFGYRLLGKGDKNDVLWGYEVDVIVVMVNWYCIIICYFEWKVCYNEYWALIK